MTLNDILTAPVNSFNVGNSDYSTHAVQPWDIWKMYNLNPWDADIVKRVLRVKPDTSRIEDYAKIIHICRYRIEQLVEEMRKAEELQARRESEPECDDEQVIDTIEEYKSLEEELKEQLSSVEEAQKVLDEELVKQVESVREL